MKTKAVPVEWILDTDSRLDAKPFLSGSFEARMLLQHAKLAQDPLSAVTRRVFHAGREGRTWVNDPAFGSPFLSSSSILRADLSYLPLLSRKQVEGNPDFLVRPQWTLISRSGTVGRMAYVRPDMDGMACSEHAMRVVPDDAKIPPGYLYAFLAGRFGIPMVTSGTYGAIIQHIEPEHIVDLPIPRVGKAELDIHRLVEASAKAAAAAQAAYSRATELAFRSIGLGDTSPKDWHAGSKLSFCSSVGPGVSLRALNHDPRMLEFFGAVRQLEHVLLSEVLSRPPFRANRFNRIDAHPGHGIPLIGQREMFRLHWEGRWISRIGIPDDGELVPPYGTIAVACIGTLGEQEVFCRALRVRKGQSKFGLSDNVLQLRFSGDYPSEVAFAFLRSEMYFRAFRCLSVGGKQQVLHPELVAKVPLPKLSAEPESAVVDLIREGDNKYDEAVSQERAAIKRVEKAIEDAA